MFPKPKEDPATLVSGECGDTEHWSDLFRVELG